MKTPRQWIGALFTRGGIVFMQVLATLPLAVVRGLGVALGGLLYVVAVPRRRVVDTNLRLCFPERTEQERRAMTRQTFVFFAQAWLDRSWLWHGHPDKLKQRLRLTGALAELDGEQPTVLFAPHFVGLDAGWAALTQQVQRSFTTIYTDQANKLLDRWILRGRQRFGNARLFGRAEGVQPIISALRAGQPLYLLPDMNFGPEESVFVPFYGVTAATVPSLSRFAKLGRAKVVPVVTRLTATGYEVEVMPAWPDVPSADFVADTALMNTRLQGYINTMPAQYYWVHKRFKTRPEGEDPLY
ncbi:lipid A biosynthesis acyltransferase [Polaromonas sp. SM01]|uniref:LpxL/LpxP family acyltransferase n=1 Tax=Polaromonas sp. SM01 TaxID=3085630 RepID=UPI002981FB99|nr:lipid A biosynthesis acyltransferase [Polaromonas sp. SM01]MDW5444091.1 lipid A biosynthesis acyltransferase [Polaromonas sp. SM01]